MKEPNRSKPSSDKKRSKPKSAAAVRRAALEAEKRSSDQPQTLSSAETHQSVTEHRSKEPKNSFVSTAVLPIRPGGTVTHSKKIFVLDTNILLHDPTAIHHFDEHDLVIPITVLEEIDRFKKGQDTLNFHAREVVRLLDELEPRDQLTTDDGVSLGDGRGHLRVIPTGAPDVRVRESFLHDTPDHRILSSALKIRDSHPDRTVVLISKDVSLRLKARSMDVHAEDYESDKIPTLDELYKGRFEINDFPAEYIDRFYQDPYAVPLSELDMEEPFPNAYFVLKSGSRSALARYSAKEKALVRIEKRSGFGITPRNAEQTFALDALTDPSIKLLTLSGKAGTGKTLLALAGAMESRRRYEQIFLARPVVPLGQQDIGYLPGDIGEKISPYMQPLWDNLSVIRGQFKPADPNHQKIQTMLANEKLKINALAFIRGRSLNRIFFIVDEAQNLTGHEVKTIITRAGEGTKIVLTGDPQQIDSPYLDSRSNGLTRLIDRMKGQEIYAHVTLERGERSELADIASELL